MKRFHYSIVNDELKDLVGEIETVPSGYIELHNSHGPDRVYYKINDAGKITDAIGEGFHESTARRRVQDFISALNASLI
jgi:hypothetical protein